MLPYPTLPPTDASFIVVAGFESTVTLGAVNMLRPHDTPIRITSFGFEVDTEIEPVLEEVNSPLLELSSVIAGTVVVLVLVDEVVLDVDDVDEVVEDVVDEVVDVVDEVVLVLRDVALGAPTVSTEVETTANRDTRPF